MIDNIRNNCFSFDSYTCSLLPTSLETEDRTATSVLSVKDVLFFYVHAGKILIENFLYWIRPQEILPYRVCGIR